MKFRFDLSPSVYVDDRPQAAANVFSLLKAIRQTGSLQQAALSVGLSYRYAWGAIREWEKVFSQDIVDMQRGKGAALTRFAEGLLRAEMRLREVVEPVIETATAEFDQHLNDAVETRVQVRFSGRPDAAMDVVTQSLATPDAAMTLDRVFCSPVDGLICLHERQAELAGFHVSPVHRPGTRLHTTFRQWLKPSDVRLIRLAWRDQGLIVAPDKADTIRGLGDLVSRQARFLNRQRSSSTRALFDQVMASEGVYPEQIAGYENYALSNELVAEAIRQRRADAGFGLKSTADAGGLHFVPLTREAYYLALRKSDQDAPWATDLLDLLRSDNLAGRIGAIPGYRPEPSLRLMSLQEALPW
jgi:molybdate transport repressor ModE-like protein